MPDKKKLTNMLVFSGLSPTLKSYFFPQLGCAELSSSFGPRVTHLLTKEGKMTIKGQTHHTFSQFLRLQIFSTKFSLLCFYTRYLEFFSINNKNADVYTVLP